MSSSLIPTVGEFAAVIDPQQEAQVIQAVLDASPGELCHSNFVVLCATTRLAREYDISNSESELCLEEASVVGQSDWLKPVNINGKETICNDTYFNDSDQNPIPSSDADRLAALQAALDLHAKEEKGSTVAYTRPAVSHENIQFFEEAGLSSNDAAGCVWALSFYTGEGSNSASRAGSLVIRKGNMVSKSTAEDLELFLSKTKMILWYLVKALTCIPYYWGVVTRHITVSVSDMSTYYKPGNIVTWLQFSSSRRGEHGSSFFKNRNAKFVIWSVKGRHIDQFSNYSTGLGFDEDEVLFLPLTRLLVLKVSRVFDGVSDKWIVHCRELELGITRGLPLLWVDDKIHEVDFEMKRHMREAMLRRKQEIKFILKSSTALALAYLKSPFGQLHTILEQSNLRIMTDMSRPDEEDGERAGARLVKELEGCFRGRIMVFTSSVSAGNAKLQQLGVVMRPGITVTTLANEAVQFCAFME